MSAKILAFPSGGVLGVPVAATQGLAPVEEASTSGSIHLNWYVTGDVSPECSKAIGKAFRRANRQRQKTHREGGSLDMMEWMVGDWLDGELYARRVDLDLHSHLSAKTPEELVLKAVRYSESIYEARRPECERAAERNEIVVEIVRLLQKLT